MRKFILVAGMLLTVACGKNKVDKALSESDGYKDKMCACKDKACADAVHKDYKEWQKKMDFSEEDMKKMSKDQMDHAENSDKAMRECRHKFDAPDAPPTPPPAPPAAGSDMGSGSAAPAAPGSAG